MKLDLATNVKCPNCKKEVVIESTFWATIFFGSLIDTVVERLKNEGGKINCPHCKAITLLAPNFEVIEIQKA